MMGIVLLLLLMVAQVTFQQSMMSTYRAGVVEHAPSLEHAKSLQAVVTKNLQHYKNFMDQAAAQGVQIIVFPENGLTGFEIDITNSTLEEASTEVPAATDNISPCFNQRDQYAKFFIDLSCAANIHKMYAVVNLIEKHMEGNKKMYHNTNVVFDKNGHVIARYRKMNLYEEAEYVPGNKDESNMATFKTDFGVTFGTFICADILFKTPSLDILTTFPEVTDIAFSTAWFAELPYFTPLSIQHGYAKSNGVNFLVAGMNNPSKKNGGSGIYLADGRIAKTYMSNKKSSKLLVYDVPKIKARKDFADNCQGASDSPHPDAGFGSYFTDIRHFPTKKSNLTQYTFMSLNVDEKIVSETVCSAGSNFCCSFNITVNKTHGSSPHYKYKLVAFNGVMVTDPLQTIGTRNCAIVACLNNDTASCAKKHVEPPIGITFESVSISTTFKHVWHAQPSTVNFDLTPTTNYMYCTKTIGDDVEIQIKTTAPHDSLLTFGIFGRVYENDGKAEGLISGVATNSLNIMYFVLFVILVIFCQ